MSKLWKKTVPQRLRPGLCALLLTVAVVTLLGACADMPAGEAPDAAAGVAEQEQPATDTEAAATDASDMMDADEAGNSDDPAAEHMAGEAEPATEAVADAEPAEEEAAVPVVEDWTQHFVAEGQYVYLGNPEAPVTILDVSDFL